jgi:hypothetical protein
VHGSVVVVVVVVLGVCWMHPQRISITATKTRVLCMIGYGIRELYIGKTMNIIWFLNK